MEIVSEVREDFAEEWKNIKERVMIEAAEKVIHNIPIKVESKLNNYWEK